MADMPASLAEALAMLQTKLPHIGKDKTARVTSQRTGKTHTYDYADLATVSAAILPLMGPLGLSFTCRPTLDGGRFVLAYELRHLSDDVGLGGQYPLPAQGTPQEIGSAITYARRYCLCAVTGVAPEADDDDGQAAEQASRKPRPRKRPANAEPETDEHGAATFAEQTRMISGAVPGTERLDGTPPDDPFLAVDENGQRREPGTLPKPPGPQPPKPARGYTGVIQAHFKRLGVDDRDHRLTATGILAGRADVLASTRDLTPDELKEVAGLLSRCRDHGALIALLADREPAMDP